jgi:alkanesulfonate monooxygenase SsuD/methylene tetrahydromethanopterin reductase-like flavin-dependent oxidoreductase (luciferase family)
MSRPFRFGVVAPVHSDLPTWREQARRIADQGFAVLLMPDVPSWQPAPGPTLAVAASTVPDLRVGTWVYASPLRPSWATAWEAHTLSLVTEGRFEMGIGTGRPGIEDELRERGMPEQSPGERLGVLRDTVARLRELDGADRRTPVVMAVRGPRAKALAAEIADTVTFATLPTDSRADVTGVARDFLASADRDVELALHVPVVGDEVAPFMARASDMDPDRLRAEESLAILPSDAEAAVDELQRRREEIGFSYVVVGAHSTAALAPAVARLSGT